MDWNGLMRAAIAERGISPALFWSLSPAELSMMLGRTKSLPMGRAGLASLLEAFPDATPETTPEKDIDE
ncbi:phage tail assembly chaperone [Profundibacterium mesophilum]|uniref:Conserved hypothetical phage protein domain containing protein n=1 Tax=Profundibacterium mesophilum KAUST100406-0324 TaxID=1037889 RepID=A0A921NVG2_9RHOB|nr:phage tail assembly chaperone [Profundibacterium mesophilum]KAF0677419.1 Conserved hypothetical phage protein domain containing protein [Profundibacterium mesophilum KAUST100406-0324]